MILGIDEVGRGPWAGPLVVAACVLNGADIQGLTDSKKLSKKKLLQYNQLIMDSEAVTCLGWVHADELDNIGMSESLVLATKRAVEQITVPYHEIIIDGTVNFLAGTTKEKFVTVMKKADLLIASVSAASIVAKVARDTYMEQQHERYPMYGFDSHVGYGTQKHRSAIDAHGVTPLHRLSFTPLKKYANGRNRLVQEEVQTETSVSIGNTGEDVAVEWLKKNGYSIVERNWKTKLCEIDIVAVKNECLYFVEVKHRKDGLRGGGLAAITHKKVKQMKFASAIYVAYTRNTELDAKLAVITTHCEPIVFEDYLELE